MKLNEEISIARRYQKAIRIDSDAGHVEAIEGFVCTESSASVLRTMSRHVSETRQAAFTWSGPYGCGKSSLALVLQAFMSTDGPSHKAARRVLGSELTETISKNLSFEKPWVIASAVGRRTAPEEVLSEALSRVLGVSIVPETEAVIKSVERHLTNGGQIALIVDEMGKLLEAASRGDADVYIFQLLAELASRSNGKFILIGILHQSFEEYASKLSREARDEWSKIQGRFVDLNVNAAGEEQVDLIARAISHGNLKIPASTSKVAETIFDEIRRGKPSVSRELSENLKQSWPLHPAVTSLLGPISRRRFGQNQRSIFGFLNSAEPLGFQDFLADASSDQVYNPEDLWDYLKSNLEASILASSSDGHRWATAAEVVDRCAGLEVGKYDVALLKTIAIIDLFKERSGLTCSESVLLACFPKVKREALKESLNRLTRWRLVVFRNFTQAYAIFAGSDFDLEASLSIELENARPVDFDRLNAAGLIAPVLAKTHYYETGALRWMEVQVSGSSHAETVVRNFSPNKGVIAQFVLVIPEEETGTRDDLVSLKSCLLETGIRSVVGHSSVAQTLVEDLRELMAVEAIQQDHPELAGDDVARREIAGRIDYIQSKLETDLMGVLSSVTWQCPVDFKIDEQPSSLSQMASQIADQLYEKAPIIQNELINRIRPASGAVAARTILLKAMVKDFESERLGIQGYPAEGGLYASVLERTGIHRKARKDWEIASPENETDTSNLSPAWKAASDLVVNSSGNLTALEIYDLWIKEPFGIQPGVMPILLVAFIMSHSEKLATYRDGVFQSKLNDVDIEVLSKKPEAIELRWVDLSGESRELLEEMAFVARDFDEKNRFPDLSPLEVGRSLVSVFEGLNPWVIKTSQLSQNAKKVRSIFKKASDPNKFLFDDLPNALGDQIDPVGSAASSVYEGLRELTDAYPLMLDRIQDLILKELGVPNGSGQALRELRERALNVQDLSGDFSLEAFVGRLSRFDGAALSVEGLATLAAGKPTRLWIDADLERSLLELARLCQKFSGLESFARVKGRPSKSRAIGLVIGTETGLETVHQEFEVRDVELPRISELADLLKKVFVEQGVSDQRLVWAALSEVGTGLLQNTLNEEKREGA